MSKCYTCDWIARGGRIEDVVPMTCINPKTGRIFPFPVIHVDGQSIETEYFLRTEVQCPSGHAVYLIQ